MEQNESENKKARRPGFCVRVSEDEHERINQMCKTTGETAPELFRKALLHRKDLEQPAMKPEDIHEIKVALSRIGNNVHQIARHLNFGGRDGWNISFNSFQTEFLNIRHMFLGKYARR